MINRFIFLQLGIPSFPACQLAPALNPRCDQHIITMVLRLMQIVGRRMFPQDKTLKFCCECAIYHPCTYRVHGGAVTTALPRYTYALAPDPRTLYSMSRLYVVCALTDIFCGHSLLQSFIPTTTQQPPVRSVTVEPSPDVLFHFAKNKAERLF